MSDDTYYSEKIDFSVYEEYVRELAEEEYYDEMALQQELMQHYLDID